MVPKIGVREFRDNLATYLETASPIAITRHGATIGYFIPTRLEPSAADIEGLKRAAGRLQAMMQEHDLTEDELVEEFQILRSRKYSNPE